MTTPEQIQAWAREAETPVTKSGVWRVLSPETLQRFAELARADLVAERDEIQAELVLSKNGTKMLLKQRAELEAEIERLKAACDKYSEADILMGGGMQAGPVAHQFYGSDFEWCNFDNDTHYQNTVEDGGWVIRALYTHPAPQAVPAGWKLVPAEANSNMYVAGAEALTAHAKMLKSMGRSTDMIHTSDEALSRKMYKAMLAAAPAVKGAV